MLRILSASLQTIISSRCLDSRSSGAAPGMRSWPSWVCMAFLASPSLSFVRLLLSVAQNSLREFSCLPVHCVKKVYPFSLTDVSTDWKRTCRDFERNDNGARR
jgi:integral membrane sensor domain MASE1